MAGPVLTAATLLPAQAAPLDSSLAKAEPKTQRHRMLCAQPPTWPASAISAA
ncbi:MAG: hypothetical protein ACRDPY_10440 [Streptosporangiaceae bacterium]